MALLNKCALLAAIVHCCCAVFGQDFESWSASTGTAFSSSSEPTRTAKRTLKGTERYMELARLNCSNFKSGPVLILDEFTLYLPHVYTEDKQIQFWVQGANRIPVQPIEPIRLNSGQNVFLRLTETLYKFHTFLVTNESCQVKLTKSFGSLNIATKQPQFTANGLRRIIVKKCCKYKIGPGGCSSEPTEDPGGFRLETDIYDNNETHFNDDPMLQVSVQTVVMSTECKHKFYSFAFSPDEVKYLINGSLMSKSMGIIEPRSYCFEDGTVVICSAEELNIMHSSVVLIMANVFLSLSIASLLIIVFTYTYLKEMHETLRGKVIIYFALSMALQNIMLLIAQLIPEHINDCHVIGYIYEFFQTKSFVLLDILLWETYYMIKCSENRYLQEKCVDFEDKKCVRIKWYLGVLVFNSVVIITLLAVTKIHPSLPRYFVKGDCSLQSTSPNAAYFIMFVGTCIVIAMVFASLCLYSVYKHKALLQQVMAEYKKYLGMTRNGIVVLFIMLVNWALVLLSYYIPNIEKAFGPLTIIQNLQGLFVFAVFIMHRPIRRIIASAFRKRECTKSAANDPEHVALRTVENGK